MKKPQGVVPSDASVEILSRILQSAYTQVASVLTSEDIAKRSRRAVILNQIERVAKEADLNVQAWVNVEIPTFYEMGMFEATKDLYKRGSYVSIDLSFGSFHKEAVEALAQDTYTSFANGLKGLTNTGQKFVSMGARQEILEKLAKGRITGDSRRKIVKEITKELKSEGITSLTDRGGRNWDLVRYGDMLARTKLTQAHNTGVVHRMVETGHDLVQVSDHFGECELCRPWENQILSVSGRSSEYTSLQKAEAEGLFHPNCRHTFTPYQKAYLDEAMVWDSSAGEYVKMGTKRKQSFETVLNKHQQSIKSIRADNLADFNKAIDKGDRTKAKRIAESQPKNHPLRAPMLEMLKFL